MNLFKVIKMKYVLMPIMNLSFSINGPMQFSPTDKFYVEEYTCDCPTPCKEIKFNVATSQADFPNDFKSKWLRQRLGTMDENIFKYTFLASLIYLISLCDVIH